MKILKIFIYLIPSYLFIYLFIICFIGDKNVKECERIFKIDLPKDIISEEVYNSYESFPYEGEKLYKFKFSEADAKDFNYKISSDITWNSMPLSSSLSILMYGSSKNNISYDYNFADKVSLPKIKNGYWKLVDDSDANILKFTDFSLAILDIDSNYLYFFKFNM